MKFRYITTALLLCIGLQSAYAQEVYSSSGRPVTSEKPKSRQKGFDASRIIFGGGMGLAFGTVTDISVAPVLGYRFTDNFAAGIGLGYEYLRIKDYFQFQDPNNANGGVIYKPYVANIYSPSVWTRYRFYKNLFAEVEYEHNFMTAKEYTPVYDASTVLGFNFAADKVNRNVPSVLVGIGLRQPITDRVSLLLMGMYDVLQKEYSPYKNTLIIRFGVVAGF
ncbi:MAG: hypothetical protein BGO70_07870 [Bacteroidetes bacterium 43-93]|nr:hypothetical protein [Bacteroidota bacterium]MBS1778778.1 hypothetical protein [Bacteroidota bacterium]OJW97687.1 MAG: hypothetical protein BGO70_07870 [Bacteroidetes bacterium 43-93]